MVNPGEQNFQPQTRDTSNGPQLHTYIPRSDGGVMIGGVAYYPQGFVPAVPTAPVITVPVPGTVKTAEGTVPVITPVAAIPPVHLP